MNAIKAVVRNGRIETDEPINLPEGTELLIPLPSGRSRPEDEEAAGAAQVDASLDEKVRIATEEESATPEAVADWLAWYATLEPLIFTPEEEASLAAWRQKVKEYSIERMRGSEALFE